MRFLLKSLSCEKIDLESYLVFSNSKLRILSFSWAFLSQKLLRAGSEGIAPLRCKSILSWGYISLFYETVGAKHGNEIFFWFLLTGGIPIFVKLNYKKL
jgi:hypothetical protein